MSHTEYKTIYLGTLKFAVHLLIKYKLASSLKVTFQCLPLRKLFSVYACQYFVKFPFFSLSFLVER